MAVFGASKMPLRNAYIDILIIRNEWVLTAIADEVILPSFPQLSCNAESITAVFDTSKSALCDA